MDTNKFIEIFSHMSDFRQEGKVKHKLIEIIFIAVVSIIENSNNWVEVEVFAKSD